MASRVVRGGDELRVAEGALQRRTSSLKVLYEDDDCLVVDKPAGLPAAPTRSAAAGTALDIARRQLRRHQPTACLWLVHRLDAPTSGVLLFAKSQRAAAALGKAFQSRTLNKVYLARVAGVPGQLSGCIDLSLRNAGGRAVVAVDGRPAQTEWEMFAGEGDSALLRLRPLSGRFHQLRAHLSAIGHPVVGDRLYGGPPAPRLMLHAATLIFPHPTSGERVEVSAPPPRELEV